MDRRSEWRLSAALHGVCELPEGERRHVVITNLSCGGCGLAGELELTVGDQVGLSVAGLGPLGASVIWTRGHMVGIALTEPLEAEVITHLVACCPLAA